MRRPASHVPACAAALLLAACAFEITAPDLGGRLTEVRVSEAPGGNVVEVGDTIRLDATGRVDGVLGLLVYDLVRDARWSVSDASVAELIRVPPPPRSDSTTPGQVLVRGRRPEVVHVAAAARGVTGTARVRVVPPLGALALRPSRDTVRVGDTLDVAADLVYVSGAPAGDLYVTYDVVGGLRMTSRAGNAARFVADSPGGARVAARVRRAADTLRVTVRPAAP